MGSPRRHSGRTAADETIRFTVSLPASLLAELDRRLVDRGYASRSELVRDLIREKLVEQRWARGRQRVHGVLTICYDHHQRELADRLIEIQHEAHARVLCTTHVHLDHARCLETIVLAGRPAEIEDLALRIAGLRGVQFARLTRA
ncbi:MAG: nickel-responsive transcriptional regulator NikR [Acidobacteria bacterium]|nr:MAG: nickel-responsive transcriptional regulator NikR [Acidobacteriota bacterium]